MSMSNEYIIRLVAGTLVLAGVLLSHFVSSYGLLLSAFVGLNLVQSSFTGICPLEMLLKHFRGNR